MKIERESMVAGVKVFSFSVAGHLDNGCPSEKDFRGDFSVVSVCENKAPTAEGVWISECGLGTERSKG